MQAKLLQQVGLAIAILTIIGSLIGYFLSDFAVVEFAAMDLLFYSFFVLGLILTTFSFWYIVCSISYGFYYGYIPTAKEIQDALSGIEAYNQSVSEDEAIDVESEFYNHTSDQYCECADRNYRNNTTRCGYIFLGLRLSLFALLMLILALPGHYIIKKRFPESIKTVTIGKEVKVSIMTEEQDKSQDQESAEQKPAEKPVWPEVHLTKEADEKDVSKRIITEQEKP